MVAGQDRLVGVQLGAVGGVCDRAQDRALGRCRLVEQQQRLVGMDRDDGRIETPRRPITRAHQYPVRQPAQRVHWRAGRHLVQLSCDRLHVVGGTSGDGTPGWRPEHRQHAVMVEEDEQIPGRIAQGVGPPQDHTAATKGVMK